MSPELVPGVKIDEITSESIPPPLDGDEVLFGVVEDMSSRCDVRRGGEERLKEILSLSLAKSKHVFRKKTIYMNQLEGTKSPKSSVHLLTISKLPKLPRPELPLL
jgi:hypothetical protein